VQLLKVIALLLLWPAFFVGAILVRLWASLFRISRRWAIVGKLTRNFSTLVRLLLNIKIVRQGEPDLLAEGGRLIVSNHLGYLDGIVLGSLFPVTYVSKKEVKGWPFIGHWVTLIGTIFVDRKSKEKVLLVVEEIAERLRQKSNVLLFPEGTSTDGERLLPFQSAFFAAPLMAGAEVAPVTLTYRRINGRPLTNADRDRVYWYGEMEFAGHFWKLLALRSIEVSVTIHPKIEASRYKNNSLGRKQLSQACHEVIARELDRKVQSGGREAVLSGGKESWNRLTQRGVR
jgi:1-acyl-sn-glycerol-3-phosphate acyltransferase